MPDFTLARVMTALVIWAVLLIPAWVMIVIGLSAFCDARARLKSQLAALAAGNEVREISWENTRSGTLFYLVFGIILLYLPCFLFPKPHWLPFFIQDFP
jgi:hypothetical protein